MDTIKGRKVAVLVEDGFDGDALASIKKALEGEGAKCEVISKAHGTRKAAKGKDVKTDKTHLTTGSIMYDAVLIPGGQQSVDKLKEMGKALHFVREAYKHCKPIAAIGEGVELIEASQLPEQQVFDKTAVDKGVVTTRDSKEGKAVATAFINAIKQHRFWEREKNKDKIPA